jgi:hypothetical protein
LAGACQGTFVPGSYVLMPAIAPGHRLQRATPHSSAPSSPAAAFALDAATFAISALTLASLRPDAVPSQEQHTAPKLP